MMDTITFALSVLFLALAGTALLVGALWAIDAAIAAMRAKRRPDRRVYCDPDIPGEDVVTRLRRRGQV
jgi:hypothetical protein